MTMQESKQDGGLSAASWFASRVNAAWSDLQAEAIKAECGSIASVASHVLEQSLRTFLVVRKRLESKADVDGEGKPVLPSEVRTTAVKALASGGKSTPQAFYAYAKQGFLLADLESADRPAATLFASLRGRALRELTRCVEQTDDGLWAWVDAKYRARAVDLLDAPDDAAKAKALKSLAPPSKAKKSKSKPADSAPAFVAGGELVAADIWAVVGQLNGEQREELLCQLAGFMDDLDIRAILTGYHDYVVSSISAAVDPEDEEDEDALRESAREAVSAWAACCKTVQAKTDSIRAEASRLPKEDTSHPPIKGTARHNVDRVLADSAA